jgi:dTDP-4-amino-4,6-dideoxygalactose transaminase
MIPLLDLKAQYRSIKTVLDAAVLDVLASGEYIQGRCVRAFEEAFADYCGGGTAVAMNSGTSALHLALLAAGIGPGDEVITVPMTFIATAAAIDTAGARPVFVDIDPATWTMDAARIEAAITPRTKAIIPVHLHGRVADMETILAIARRHGLIVIEDAAQAHGAEHRGRRAGSFGDIACFSFYAGKNLGAAGEGGAALSRNPEFIRTMRMMRDWGAEAKYRHVMKGFNYRMDNLQGAVLGVKLRKLESWTQRRREIAAIYDAHLDALGLPRPAPQRGGDRHVYHVYAIRISERDRVRHGMAEAGIDTGVHYPIPVHLQPVFAALGYRPGDFPVSERLAAETLSLPMFPEMSPEQIERVCDALSAIVGQRGCGQHRTARSAM